MKVFSRRLFLVSALGLLLLTLFFTPLGVRLSDSFSAILAYSPNNSKIGAKSQPIWNATYEEPCDLYCHEDSSTIHEFLDIEDSTRFVIEADGSEQQLKELKETIHGFGGVIRETVSIGKDTLYLAIEALSPCSVPLVDNLWKEKLVKDVKPAIKVKASHLPNDPYWSSQWGPQKIEAPAAWDVTLGSSSVLVAIVDTGIDYTHPDLADNYVPLGYDWVNNDTDPKDDYGHGTHCAGIVAAEIDNSIGIAGLAQVRIMAEKVLSVAGWGWDTWVAQGIIHATDCGANIISLSLGSPFPSDPLYDAIEYASERNVLVVAAAGNTGASGYHYPAAFEKVIAVAATDSSDYRAGFSTYGNWIDVSAPGVSIYATMPTYHVTMNDYGYTMTYSYMSGTSMACPHVSGVAALIWSRFPEFEARHVRWILEHTGDDLGRPGFDEFYGNGRVNARKALMVSEHDLGVSEVRYPHRVNPGQTCNFNVTVGNFGRTNETNVVVRFYANESFKGERIIPFLELFSCTAINFSLETTGLTYYRLKFEITPVLGETNVANNILNCHLLVRFPTILRVPSEYSTIKLALNYTGDGDSIIVDESNREEGQIDIFTSNITLSANGIVTLYGYHVYNAINIDADHVTIEGFDFKNCSSYAVNIRGKGNILRNNYFANNSGCIRIYDSSECLIAQNYLRTHSTVWYTELGVLIECSWNNTFSQNRIVSDSLDGGVRLVSSSNNTVSFNTITGVLGFVGRGALHLDSSTNNIIISNNLMGNRFGIVLSKSPSNVLRNNIMRDNLCNFAPSTGSLAYSWYGPSDVDESNTVDGKPIIYWVNESNKTVPSNAGTVILVNSRNITVENLELKNSFYGVLLVNSSNVLICGNSINNNWNNYEYWSGGIYSDGRSSNITVTKNNVTSNYDGIILEGQNHNVSFNTIANNWFLGVRIPSNSILYKNNITGNQKGGAEITGSGSTVTLNNIMSNLGPCLSVSGSNHTISLNNIIANGRPSENIFGVNHDGLYLGWASNCTVTANNVIGIDRYAVYLYGSSDNRIFHNNFMNNSMQVWVSSGLLSNFWDDGYPSGGNYWSTYNGTDGDEDGLGDTPYTLAVNNTDLYPLMTPWTENPPPHVYTLRISGRVNDSPMEGFYDTTYPRPGTYFFAEVSAIRVDATARGYDRVFIDHFELDGASVGSGEHVVLIMDADHNLTAFFSVLPPLNVSISPTTATVKPADSVTFNSTVQNGNASYEYLWFVNGREVWNATEATWAFKPGEHGIFAVQLLVRDPRYPFVYMLSSGFSESNTATVIVLLPGDVDGNFVVDILDVVKITSIYASRQGDPPFNPDCDLDNDGTITILDVVICTSHYGERGP